MARADLSQKWMAIAKNGLPHSEMFFKSAKRICKRMPWGTVEEMARELAALRHNEGRLFVLGVGGSAANASHAVCDFRKLCQIEAYAPTDNIAELTARANDNGFRTIFLDWLVGSNFNSHDAILVLSVGGGTDHVSHNLVHAINYAKSQQARVFGIVGLGGHTAKVGDVVIVVPEMKPEWVTPLSESFQSLILHCLVSHPSLQKGKTKW